MEYCIGMVGLLCSINRHIAVCLLYVLWQYSTGGDYFKNKKPQTRKKTPRYWLPGGAGVLDDEKEAEPK
jgi:hypothetical protein